VTTPQSLLVYCVVINLNGKKLLLETLESLTKMTYGNFRILVTDNGSTDGSGDAVRTAFPDVVFLENGANLGFGEGNNVGIRYALAHGAEWVFILNNDIEVDPGLLSQLMKVAVTDEGIGLLGPKIYFYSEPDVIWCAGCKVNYWTGILSHRGIREKDAGRYDTVEPTAYVNGCAMLARRSVLEKVGMFDEAYFPAYTEDADLSIRASRAGYKLMYVPAGKLWHKVSSFSGGGLTPLKTRLKVEHNLIFFKRYARWYHWITIPICVGSVGLVFVAKEMLKGNFSVVGSLSQGFIGAIGRLFGRG
jgi:GT2 family glycosyltransferase